MRTLYGLRSLWQLRRASLDESGSRQYWQAGKNVGDIDSIESAGDIVASFAETAHASRRSQS
jgi:nitronate monooxygenase